MATSLRARKGVLSKQKNIIAKELDDLEKVMAEGPEGEPSTNFLKELQDAEIRVRSLFTSFERSLYAFTETVDKLPDPLSLEEMEKVSEQIDKAQDLICRTETVLAKCGVRKQQLELPSSSTMGRNTVNRQDFGAQIPRIELPKIPMPEFSGKSWQWDNFWELYNATVHSLPISDLQKFNYLLKSLKGEARETIARFQVTSANYELAVNHLRQKYGRSSEIVCDLHRRLEKWTARSSDLKDQRRLFDQLAVITTQLESRGQSLDNPWLMNKILSKFTEDIQRRVLKEKLSPSEETWSHQRQMRCLDDVLRQEEQIEEQLPKQLEAQRKKVATVRTEDKTEKRVTPFCLYCDDRDHWSISCRKITDPKQRLDHLKANNRCIGCGSQRHTLVDCKSKGCQNCGKKHHTSTCFKSNATRSEPAKAKAAVKKKTPPARQNVVFEENANSDDNAQNEDILKDHTVLTVEQTDQQGKLEEKNNVFLLSGTLRTKHPSSQQFVYISVLLDTGADRSFIDSKLARELNLPNHGTTSMKLCTFGSQKPITVKCMITHLQIWDSKDIQRDFELFTHDTPTKNRVQGTLDRGDLNFIKQKRITLCSSSNAQSGHPQVILGCDQLWNLIKFEAPHFTLPSGLVLIPTHVGYMVSGKKILKKDCLKNISTRVNMVQSKEELDHWEKHWLEAPEFRKEYAGPEKQEKQATNERVLQEFNDSVEKRREGYFVRLPFKKEHEFLPDNRILALKRLQSVLHMYRDQPQILQQYHEVFQEQLRKKILEEVDESNDSFVRMKHYLPHQPVFTPEKDTTKFRIVFDASAHYKDRPSLNDIVHQGPTMLPKIYGILLRFRTKKYVLLSDVEKAFLQVYLHEMDRDFTRCLWIRDIKRPPTEDNLIVYRFTRITFGINASPFLLSNTILYHLNNYVEDRRLAEEISTNLYVDNLFVGADSSREAFTKYKKLKSIFEDISMNLRAFVSNSSEVMNGIAEVDRCVNLSPKVLGIPWDSEADEFNLIVKINRSDTVTKRIVAQQIASVYDPLGWFIPLLIRAKVFQQKLWKERYDWDQQISTELTKQWNAILTDLQGYRSRLPRCIVQKDVTYTLVTYCDASTTAMAACSYLVTKTVSHFLMAKSKLADIKHATTTPKLELNAALIGTRLTCNILLSLRPCIQIDNILILSDSEIALKWIQMLPIKHETGQYVSNRVRDIHRIAREMEGLNAQVQFGYLDTNRNPADCATRGVAAKDFSSHIWWTAYTWNEITCEGFTSSFLKIPEDDGEEEEMHTVVHVEALPPQHGASEILDLSRYSDLTKARRSLAFALRFLSKIFRRLQGSLREKLKKSFPWIDYSIQSQFLCAREMQNAESVMIRSHQSVHLHPQYKRELGKDLNLREDEEGILRAYGRLNNSNLPESAKNPIIIAPKTDLSRLIIAESHRNYHKGTAHTISDIRQRFWIPKIREQVKRYIRTCVPCQKVNGLPYRYPEMPNLPSSRVTRARPFQHIGLDYFGPLTIKEDDGSTSDVYACIFTCCVTRLLHLEIVSDGTTAKFLNAFRRFVARRGRPDTVTCDNAPTFLLGSKILNEGMIENDLDEDVAREMSNNLIEWIHITPHSPWKGGFYERLIKSIKLALTKTIGKTVLTRDLLETFLAEIEACLNSRPLTYQETSIEDTAYELRPIDFIQRDMIITLPLKENDERTSDDAYLPPAEAARMQTHTEAVKALQSSQAFTENYWRIWRNHYLTALREQHRRHIDSKQSCAKTPCEGDVVLLSDPGQKRNQWKMARVTKLVISKDGAVREAEVLCAKRRLRRPVNQLFPLEIDGVSEQNHTPSRGEDEQRNSPDITSEGRYNLRPRRRKNQRIEDSSPSTAAVHAIRSCPKKTSLTWPSSVYLKMALALVAIMLPLSQAERSTHEDWLSNHVISYREEGLFFNALNADGYELRMNEHCFREQSSPVNKVLQLLPEELLYESEVTWELCYGDNFITVKKSRSAQPFCTIIDCLLCSPNILNPECWSLSTILGFGAVLYLVITLQPNMPFKITNMSTTLSVPAIPPLPDFDTNFISSGKTTALRDKEKKPILQCLIGEDDKMLRNKTGTSELQCRIIVEYVSAESTWDAESFLVPYLPFENLSTLRFMLTYTKVRWKCSAKCDLCPTFFDITGYSEQFYLLSYFLLRILFHTFQLNLYLSRKACLKA